MPSWPVTSHPMQVGTRRGERLALAVADAHVEHVLRELVQRVATRRRAAHAHLQRPRRHSAKSPPPASSDARAPERTGDRSPAPAPTRARRSRTASMTIRRSINLVAGLNPATRLAVSPQFYNDALLACRHQNRQVGIGVLPNREGFVVGLFRLGGTTRGGMRSARSSPARMPWSGESPS